MPPEWAARLAAPIDAPRFVLEPLGGGHAQAFFGPMQDERLYQWISLERPASVEALRQQWQRIENRLSPDGRFAWPTWAVRRRADGEYLGRVDAEVSPQGEATFGYYIFAAHWGQGIASEAVRASSDALIARGVHRLVATVTAGHIASVRVLLKAGFERSRLLPRNELIHGEWVDDEEYVRCARPAG